MRKLAVVAALVAAGLAHLSQRAVDERRHGVDGSSELLFLPSPASFDLVTMGYDEPVADLLWIRAVLLFGEHQGTDPSPAWGEWLQGMLEAIAVLDPSWRTPYQYGGTMLRSMGNIEGSDAIFELGMEALPDDAYFPFAIGMNHYLHREDARAAVEWIEIAASKPNAPNWYRVAAAGLLAKQDMIPVAIRFLEEQRETTTDPAILEMIDGRITRLHHKRWVQTFESSRGRYQQKFGTDIQVPEDIARLGTPLPPDPLGGAWVLAADGVVRSSVRELELAEKARRSERGLLKRR